MLYLGFCGVSWAFVTFRSDSFPLGTCGFVLES